MNISVNKVIEDKNKGRVYVAFSGFAWLAAFWSYSINHSLLWAIFHFFCGPAYLAYRVVFHTTLLPR